MSQKTVVKGRKRVQFALNCTPEGLFQIKYKNDLLHYDLLAIDDVKSLLHFTNPATAEVIDATTGDRSRGCYLIDASGNCGAHVEELEVVGLVPCVGGRESQVDGLSLTAEDQHNLLTERLRCYGVALFIFTIGKGQFAYSLSGMHTDSLVSIACNGTLQCIITFGQENVLSDGVATIGTVPSVEEIVAIRALHHVGVGLV